MKTKSILLNGYKVYQYPDGAVSNIRLPDYCPKCHKRNDVYLSINENGLDFLRCCCGYSVIAPSIGRLTK